jgi:hypothetical protein
MTGKIRNPHVQTLCRLALEDEATLQFPVSDLIYGFHAQQGCEKLLKALISSHNRSYPFTHNLEKLVDLLAECHEELPATPYDLLNLEPFAVEHRYDVGGSLTADDRTAVRASVAILREHILARILEIEGSSIP